MKYLYPGLIALVLISVGSVAYLTSREAAPSLPEEVQVLEVPDVQTPEPSAPAEEPVATPKPTSTPKPVATPTPTPAPTPGAYTMAQVAAHASKTSCWSVVSGKVYDLTSWIGQHPGGSSAILRMCGKDGTADFVDQHGGQRRPEAELASFKIGVLAN